MINITIDEIKEIIRNQVKQSTATKKKVGACLVVIDDEDKIHTWAGHNHHPSGEPMEYFYPVTIGKHTGWHVFTDPSVIHAEGKPLENFDIWVERGGKMKEARMFINFMPCASCASKLVNRNIDIEILEVD